MIPERFAPVLAELAPLAERFAGAGHRLYLVGGTVRDLMLAKPNIGDYDATTDAIDGLWNALGDVSKTVGDLVGQDAVDLFRHLPIIAAQSGLDMNHRNSLLDGDQRTCQRGIDIADDQNTGWPMRVDDRFEAPHDFGSLNSM